MTHKDKQDVIAVCNILADKMSDSGKVAVQQIIGAVEDMVENEPCEDAISRAALLEELGEEPFNWNDSPEEFQEVRDYQWFRSLVENAPSITTRKIRWIPCSERLPEGRMYCLITVEITPYNSNACYEVRASWFDGRNFADKIYIDNIVAKRNVIAWMPLPERYKESED